MIEARFGFAELRRVEAILRTVPAELRKQATDGIRAALKPLPADVHDEAMLMPSGYRETLAGSLKVTSRVYGQTLKASVRILAMGKSEERDVVALNAGRLRHPLFRNRRQWYTTTVPPRFVDDPIDRTKDRLVDETEDARDKIADHILEG